MRVCILQPTYLPWLGYFEQIHRADIFVFYDDVQYSKHSWQNRNRIKTPAGQLWLTVPTLKTEESRKIRDMRIDNKLPWARKHLKSIKTFYCHSRYYNDYIPYFHEIYLRRWEHLADLNIECIRRICELLGIHRQFARSSELEVKGERSERLVKICQLFHADAYFSGQSAKDYLKEELFKKAGITVEYQVYKHPEYQQLFGEFVPYLSTIDLLFNCGSESLEIVLSGGAKRVGSSPGL